MVIIYRYRVVSEIRPKGVVLSSNNSSSSSSVSNSVLRCIYVFSTRSMTLVTLIRPHVSLFRSLYLASYYNQVKRVKMRVP